MTKVYSTLDAAAANVVSQLLAGAGIAHQIFDNEWPYQPIFTVCVLSEGDVPAAQQIVQEFDAGKHRETGGAPWVCPMCGETIEAQFTECWACTAADDDA